VYDACRVVVLLVAPWASIRNGSQVGIEVLMSNVCRQVVCIR
jgi:hypothetical protein